jgi:3',5'-cyclic AMP phosphodiesterase CpdA
VAAAFSLAVPALAYRRQIVSYVTHLRGSPTSTEPFTAPVPQPALRIAVVGDVGHPGGRLRRTAAAIDQAAGTDRYDALLLLGDNVYPAGDPDQLERTVFEPFGPLLDGGAQLLAILGNHDVTDGHGDEQIRRLGQRGRWWSADLGPVLVVGLDSTEPTNPEQLAWLEKTLAASADSWRVVAVHHPPYSAGYQGSNLTVRRTFGPIFERYGVQLVLSGHEHDYQRSRVINGVTYVVSGAATDTRRTGKDDFTAFAASWHHFVDLAVWEDHMLVRAVNQTVRVFDAVALLGL